MTAPLKRWPELALALVYWWSRLHRLTAFPAFDDETLHIRWAKMVWYLRPFQGADDGRVLNVLTVAAGWPFGPSALWVARAVYFLIGIAGFVCLMKAGEQLFARPVGLLAGGMFVLLPFAIFYERLALADAYGIALLACVVAASAISVKSRTWAWPILGGAALAGLVLSKLNNLVFAAVPLLALVACGRRKRLVPALRRIAALYGVALACGGPIIAFLIFRAHSTLGFANLATRAAVTPLGERILDHIAVMSEMLTTYATWPVLVLSVTAIPIGLRIRPGATAYLVLIALLLPTLYTATIDAQSLKSRFVVPTTIGIALLASVPAAWLTARASRWAQWSAIAGLLVVIGGAGAFRFQWYAWYAPERLALPATEHGEYVEDWPSGFGVDAVARQVPQWRADGIQAVIVTEGWHVPALSLYLGPEQDPPEMYNYDEPGLRIKWLKSGCDPSALIDGERALYVTARNRYRETNNCLLADKTLLASFPKPGGQETIDVYEIRPLP